MKVINLAKIDFAGGGSAPTPPVPPGPTPSVPAKDVNFRDYDGSIVASYTKAEFAALTALPAAPVHEGLTFQEWNYTLADAQSYVAANGKLDIGATYTTSDGATRIYITLTEGRTSPKLSLGVDGTVDIDWGDGSAHDTMTGINLSRKDATHNYVSPGDYVISITPTEGTTLSLIGDSFSGSYLLYSGLPTSNARYVYQNSVNRVNLGQGVVSMASYSLLNLQNLTAITIPQGVKTIGQYAFSQCRVLSYIVIPNTVTSIGASVFRYCYSLLSLMLPKSVTSIGNSICDGCSGIRRMSIPEGVNTVPYAFFSDCSVLNSLTIPRGITSIGQDAVLSCVSLTSVIIPETVTTIDTGAFRFCYNLTTVKCLSITPPTLQSNSFNGTPPDLVIYVPAASVDAYKAASGWSDYASQIQPMP